MLAGVDDGIFTASTSQSTDADDVLSGDGDPAEPVPVDSADNAAEPVSEREALNAALEPVVSRVYDAIMTACFRVLVEVCWFLSVYMYV